MGFLRLHIPPDGRKRRRAAVEEKFFRLPANPFGQLEQARQESIVTNLHHASLAAAGGIDSGCPSNHQSNAAASPCLVKINGVFGDESIGTSAKAGGCHDKAVFQLAASNLNRGK